MQKGVERVGRKCNGGRYAPFKDDTEGAFSYFLSNLVMDADDGWVTAR